MKGNKMGINLDKMRAKLATLKGQGGDRDNFWRPEDGTQAIRIVPTPDGDPFKEKWFHYNLGNTPGFLCPKRNYAEECPVCEFASQLWRDGVDSNDDGSKKVAKSLFVRPRFFSPVMVRGEEDKGIRIWGYGKMAYENLLSLVLNPEYGDITDPETGTDLTMTYGKPSGASFPQTKLVPRRRSSELCEDMTPEKCAELLESIPDLEGMFERKTSDEVGALLDTFVNSGVEDPEAVSSETQKFGGTSTTTDEEPNAVDQAFAELGAL
tara:strand:+ start:195 stop:992 length:798 start_codon:yes stop_codon:yes gene_type:complete